MKYYFWYFLGFILLNELFYWLMRVQPMLASVLYLLFIGGLIYWVVQRRKQLIRKRQEFFQQNMNYGNTTYRQSTDDRIKQDQVIDVEYKETEIK